jgi:hypothetical protein
LQWKEVSEMITSSKTQVFSKFISFYKKSSTNEMKSNFFSKNPGPIVTDIKKLIKAVKNNAIVKNTRPDIFAPLFAI